MGGLDGCRGGGGRLSLVVLVGEKPNLVSEKSGNFIYLWCWQPCLDKGFNLRIMTFYSRENKLLSKLYLLNVNLRISMWLLSGVAKSQKSRLVHGQMVLEKHLSVPMHQLSVLLQIQMQVFKKWLNKQNYDLTATLMFNIL